jgi:hypothetical protein
MESIPAPVPSICRTTTLPDRKYPQYVPIWVRDIIRSLKEGGEYRLEVADQTGTVLRVLRLTAESFYPR